MERLLKVLPAVLLMLGMAVVIAACWMHSTPLGILAIGGCTIGLSLIIARGDDDG